MSGRVLKRAFKYRFYPSDQQAQELNRTFGCVRWYGRDLVVVDRWFPSSKVCSVCGAVRDGLALNVREWTCRCGATHDRDVNAARTIRAAGLAVLACGDGVRPARAEALAGSRR